MSYHRFFYKDTSFKDFSSEVCFCKMRTEEATTRERTGLDTHGDRGPHRRLMLTHMLRPGPIFGDWSARARKLESILYIPSSSVRSVSVSGNIKHFVPIPIHSSLKLENVYFFSRKGINTWAFRFRFIIMVKYFQVYSQVGWQKERFPLVLSERVLFPTAVVIGENDFVFA